MSDNSSLPEVIVNSIPTVILKLTETQSWEQNYSLKNGIELWIESSWNMAKNLGLEPEDYVEWMLLGEWNLAGSKETLDTIISYTSLAGREAWALKKANISIESAVEMSVSDGLAAVVENAKIMSGLYKLMPSDNTKEISKPKVEPKDYTIDFPSNY